MSGNKRPYIFWAVFVTGLLIILSGCSNGSQSLGGIDGDNSDNDGLDQSDGDLADGDAMGADGDSSEAEMDWEATEVNKCIGACSDPAPLACFGQQLCICNKGVYRLRTCDEICRQNGLGEALDCDYDNEQSVYSCFCSEPNKVCKAEFSIDGLPYTMFGDTSEAQNNFGVFQSCFDWGVMGPDQIFEIYLYEGNEIEVTVAPVDMNYDPAIVIALSCSNLSSCHLGRDNNLAGEPEVLNFKAKSEGRYFIAVDSGYQPEALEAKGQYVLTVTGRIADHTDGDADSVDGDADIEKDGDADVEQEGEGSESDEDRDNDLPVDGDIDSDPTDGDLEGAEFNDGDVDNLALQ